jgi:circadian clock protein KaiC
MKDYQAIGALGKVPSGISGFDDITFGGLPQGRPTSWYAAAPAAARRCSPWSFWSTGPPSYRRARRVHELRGVRSRSGRQFFSLGFDLERLQNDKKIILDYVHVDRSEIEETGEYNLEGLFVRLGFAIDAIGAKRVVLDTLEALFSGFTDHTMLRSEIRRIFRWLKDRGITAVITAERGDREGALTRHGLEEYVSDCVIDLNHRVTDQITTRYMRVVKYRGTTHGTNVYPFLIDEGGISVLPITSVGLDYTVSSERISTGIPRLDAMLDGKGLYRGSSMLLSGTAGTGKTTSAPTWPTRPAARGGAASTTLSKSPAARSCATWLDRPGPAAVGGRRPAALPRRAPDLSRHGDARGGDPQACSGIESHADGDRPDLQPDQHRPGKRGQNRPDAPGGHFQGQADHLGVHHAAGQCRDLDAAQVGVSSLADTWVLLKDIESGGEKTACCRSSSRAAWAIPTRLREFLFTSEGVELSDVYTGPAGVLTGSARLAQESRDREEARRLEQEIERKQRELLRKRQIVEAETTLLRTRLEMDEEEISKTLPSSNSKNDHRCGKPRTHGAPAHGGQGIGG